jgi:hypothetical protein
VVEDSALYSGTSNTVTVNASGALSLTCSAPKNCSLSGGSGIATLFYPGGSQVDATAPYNWSGWAGGDWNAITGSGSNVRAVVNGSTVYPQ